MRLIDADLLSEDAFEVQTQEYGNIEVVGLDAIDSMVTIDAEPVRHGQWIAMHYEGGILDGTDVDKCSKCGAERVIEEPKYKTKYNYCPNCGAKMDKTAISGSY